MASTREQLQQLQKAQKRARVQTADDSILEEETVDEHAEEDTPTFDDQENKQPVQFQPGTTNRGATCLWYHGRGKLDRNFGPERTQSHRCSITSAGRNIDVDKQVDTARAVRLQHSRARPMRNVIKEQHVMNVLDDANFDTDEGLIDAVHLLGLVMQGFVDGLRVPNEDEEENETSEEE